MKRALIIGINGQDGSYLAEMLLDKGYQVVGWVRESERTQLYNLCHVVDRIELTASDLLSQADFTRCLEIFKPDEIYNLAAPSMPYGSWEEPILVGDVAGLAVARLLEAIRLVRPTARFYQASTSEMFGEPVEEPQTENTPFFPRNPYGIAKLYAHWMVLNYQKRYNMFAVSGILFNHESPRRGYGFVTRKITSTAVKIKQGLASELRLGDLDARRDWGYAPDFVRAIWMMLQHETPDTFVIGTGQTHSVREFCQAAFECLDLDYRDFVIQDERFMRPPEIRQLVANPSKACTVLGWEPTTSFSQIVREMVFSDLELLRTSPETFPGVADCTS